MLENTIRNLAKSYYYQFLYTRAKDLTNITFFENTSDFSNLQIMFLQWLEVYKVLYLDLAHKETYITEDVIKDNIRTDAYLLYKSKYKNNEDKKRKIINLSKDNPSIMFRPPKKEVK